MFNFKDGIQSVFDDSAEKLTARGLGSTFSAKASGPVVRGPSVDLNNTLEM